MKFIINRSQALLSLFAALIFFSISGAYAWQFNEVEEDWGPACFASEPHKSGDVMLLSAQGELAPVMLVSLQTYPRKQNNMSVSLDFHNGNNFQLSGFVDDYYGNVYVDINRDIIDEMQRGGKLTIRINRGIRVSVSLNNATSTLNQFLICANAKDVGNTPASTPTGHWASLTDIGPGWQPGPNPIDQIEYRISDRGYVELRGRLYLENVQRAERRGGNKIYRVLLQLPKLSGQKYSFYYHDNVRTEREGVGYGQAHRMEVQVFDNQLVFPHTETQNPSNGTPENVLLNGLRIPIE
ncbi:MAG: hypothetical protein ABJO09_09835 [Hyphomicrobiales bacterium]